MGQVLEPGFYLYLELVYLKANKLENSQLLRRCAFHRMDRNCRNFILAEKVVFLPIGLFCKYFLATIYACIKGNHSVT